MRSFSCCCKWNHIYTPLHAVSSLLNRHTNLWLCFFFNISHNYFSKFNYIWYKTNYLNYLLHKKIKLEFYIFYDYFSKFHYKLCKLNYLDYISSSEKNYNWRFYPLGVLSVGVLSAEVFVRIPCSILCPHNHEYSWPGLPDHCSEERQTSVDNIHI